MQTTPLTWSPPDREEALAEQFRRNPEATAKRTLTQLDCLWLKTQALTAGCWVLGMALLVIVVAWATEGLR